MNSLFIAAETGRVDILKSSISAGADVNAQDKDYDTPLHESSFRGHMSIVKALIAAGADVNIRGYIGATPLMLSAMNGHIGITKLLIAAGADVNDKKISGVSPLNACAIYGHKDIIKVLIAAGAVADSVPAEYISPEEEGGKALIKYLLLYQYRSTMKSKRIPKSCTGSKMWNECKKQVKEMRETRLGDSSTSFFGFMTETDKNKLALYLSKKKFGMKSKQGKISYMKKFPMYLEDIEAQFKIGNERACLLLKSQKLLTHCFCYTLPQEIIGKISEFMTNEDIQSFLTVNNRLK